MAGTKKDNRMGRAGAKPAPIPQAPMVDSPRRNAKGNYVYKYRKGRLNNGEAH